MESLLEEELIEQLCFMYRVKDIHKAINIFYIRAMIYFNSKKIGINDLVDFICRELNLPNEDFIYKGDKITINSIYLESSLENIVTNIYIRHIENRKIIGINNECLNVKDELINIYNDIERMAIRKTKNIRKRNIYYKHCLIYSKLIELYNIFNLDFI